MSNFKVGDIVRLKHWKNFDAGDFCGGIKTSNFRDISYPSMNGDMAAMSEAGLLAKIRVVEEPSFGSRYSTGQLYGLDFFQESEGVFGAQDFWSWKESWLEPVDGFTLMEKEEN